jgi:biopolymer transport protein ExbD
MPARQTAMPLKTHQDEQPTLNLTPMIDVVFLLIIFFMVGAKFTELEREIDLEVPQVSDVAALAPAPEKKVVNVHRDGTITLDKEVVTLEQLTVRLASARRQYADLGVVVRGDGEGSFQQVAAALSAVRRSGVAEMGIAVRMAHDGPPRQLR